MLKLTFNQLKILENIKFSVIQVTYNITFIETLLLKLSQFYLKIYLLPIQTKVFLMN